MSRHLALAFALALAPAVALGQESAAPMIHGAEVRIGAKKWDDARRFLLEEAIPAFPQSAELWYWLGVVHAQGTKRDTEEAAKAFATANKLADPGNAELKQKIQNAVQAMWAPLVNTAAKALEAGDNARAESLLEQAVAINPEGAEGWMNLGTVYLRQNKTADAVQALEKAHALKPDNMTIVYNLGITYHQLGRDAKKAGDESRSAEYLGKAEATYKAYLEKNPGDVDITNSLAALYQERGDEAKMRQTLGQVAASEAATQLDQYNAGLAALKGKEFAKAAEAFRKAIQMSDASDPQSGDIVKASRENLGLVLIQQKKYDEAIQVLQELIATNPDAQTAATAHEYLGYAYRDAGRKDEAAAAFSRSEELKKSAGRGTSR